MEDVDLKACVPSTVGKDTGISRGRVSQILNSCKISLQGKALPKWAMLNNVLLVKWELCV